MAKPKYDGVVEAVHYKPDGQVDWVRVFERRGPTWSDYQILKREDLIKRLRSGKRFMVGKRILQMAGTFEVSDPVSLIGNGDKEVLVTGELQADQDNLKGVPLL